MLDRLKDGETRDEVFVSLYESDDTAGMSVLDKMNGCNEQYRSIMETKQQKEDAQKWLNEHDLYFWQDELMKVIIFSFIYRYLDLPELKK